MTPLERTKHLQEHWGFETPSEPDIRIETLKASLSQISEELVELDEIIDEFDGMTDGEKIREVSDVAIDLMEYVQQMIVRCGLVDRYVVDSHKIYENNLTKICTTKLEAGITAEHYGECYVEAVGDHWVVKRMTDHKVMKPLGFVPVEL